MGRAEFGDAFVVRADTAEGTDGCQDFLCRAVRVAHARTAESLQAGAGGFGAVVVGVLKGGGSAEVLVRSLAAVQVTGIVSANFGCDFFVGTTKRKVCKLGVNRNGSDGQKTAGLVQRCHFSRVRKPLGGLTLDVTVRR